MNGKDARFENTFWASIITSNLYAETQLDPCEGKCSSSAVPSNVLSRHLLDSVLPLLVTLRLLL